MINLPERNTWGVKMVILYHRDDNEEVSYYDGDIDKKRIARILEFLEKQKVPPK